MQNGFFSINTIFLSINTLFYLTAAEKWGNI